jgi:hypothetical protein
LSARQSKTRLQINKRLARFEIVERLRRFGLLERRFFGKGTLQYRISNAGAARLRWLRTRSGAS